MGPSMLPTFNTRGDVLLLEHITTTFGHVRVGMIICMALFMTITVPKSIAYQIA